MSKEPQSRRVIDLGIDADMFAELSRLKPSWVFANFANINDALYLKKVADSIGVRPDKNDHDVGQMVHGATSEMPVLDS